VDLRQLQAAASAQGVTLWRFDLRSTGDIADAFAAIKDERLDALVAFGDPLFITRVPFSLVPSLARSQRVAALYDRRGFADVGGLASYGPDPPTMWRSAASYVAQVLQGRTPAALPVAFVGPELVLNDRAAKALGLTLPTSAVSRATEVLR
jgi:putative ABC transport system substrate-binding protein